MIRSVRRSLARAAAALALAAAAAPLAACASHVRADAVGAEAVYRGVQASALSGGEPSVAARLAVERAGLSQLWEDEPARAIVALHRAAEVGDTRERLYALAELSMAEGRRTGDARWSLGAAVYAHLFLFGKADAPPPSAFDPRFRLACDICARGLADAFRDDETREFRPRSGRRPLPVGWIDIDLPQERVVLAGESFDLLQSADDFAVEGMRSRVRREGFGLPLIAGRRADAGPVVAGVGRVSDRLRVPATAVLTVDGELADAGAGRAKGTLHLVAPQSGPTLRIRDADVPLAVDVTAPVAHQLTESKFWSHELLGFLAKSDDFENGLLLAQPWQKGKIPLILVHGTASSPARWAELLNEVSADPEIAKRYQPWLFVYSTGAPILVSAASLRDAITQTVRTLDPEGQDPALRRIVVMGHSQGGLLTRLVATSSGDRFWQNMTDRPIDSLDLSADERAQLERVFFFEPLSQVERVIFLATPHRGSFVAGNFFGRLGSSLIALPQTLVNDMTGIVSRNIARLSGDRLGQLPTAVDNMDPGSAFCAALAERPIAERVRVNSIVAVDGEGAPEDLDDGVVAWKSAHLPTAESELLVRSPHSCQGDPRTILEVRRILHLHAAKR